MPTSLPEHFEDFAEARREGFLKVKELKDKGEKICGAFRQSKSGMGGQRTASVRSSEI